MPLHVEAVVGVEMGAELRPVTGHADAHLILSMDRRTRMRTMDREIDGAKPCVMKMACRTRTPQKSSEFWAVGLNTGPSV